MTFSLFINHCYISKLLSEMTLLKWKYSAVIYTRHRINPRSIFTVLSADLVDRQPVQFHLTLLQNLLQNTHDVKLILVDLKNTQNIIFHLAVMF